MYRFTSMLFPNSIAFEFRIANGEMVKLAFPSNTKICDFIKDVNEKAMISFNISKNQTLDIIEVHEKNAYGIPLNIDDQLTLREKYADDYNKISFYIGCKLSV